MLSGTVDEGGRSRVVALNRVVQECDLVAVLGDPRVGDPARGLVEDLPDGILEPDLPAVLTNDGETPAVRGPVGPEHVLEDLLRRAAAGHPQARQRARARERDGAVAIQRNGHLTRWRHGEHFRVQEAEGTGLRAVESRDEDLERAPIPTRRVEDRLAVRRESRRTDRPAAERELVKLRGRHVAGAFSEPVGRRHPRQREGHADEKRKATAAESRHARVERGPRRRGAGERLEVEGEVVRGVKPLLGVLLEAMPDDALEPRLHVLVRRREIRRLLLEDRRHRLRGRVAVKRPRARECLVEDRTEGKDVRARVGGFAFHLLGRHVAESPHDHARLRRGRRGRQVGLRTDGAVGLRQLRETEVEDLDAAVFGDEQVFGFQVAVHDPLFVRRRQAARDLDRVVRGLAHRQRPARHSRPKRFALEQLLHDVGRALVLAELVDGGDVRVVQPARGLRLLLEAAQPAPRPG